MAFTDDVKNWWQQNVLSRLEHLNRTTLAYGCIAMAAIIFLSVNLISSAAFRNVKADLTDGDLFTISEGTYDVLSALDEPIQFRMYFSKVLGSSFPAYSKYFERIRALLEQYQDISKGRLQVTYHDPEPFTDAEDRAVASGLRGLQLNREGDRGYFGLAASNSTDNEAVISFFNPNRERFLEYDLTKLIYSLDNPIKPKVGLVSGIKLSGGQTPQGQPMPAWLIMNQISEFFDVKDLGQRFEKVPDDVDILMIVQPSALSERALYAIDQFAVGGGKILAFVDPVDEIGRSSLFVNPQVKERADFGRLLKAWGIGIDKNKVAGDITNARRVQFAGGQGQPVITEYVAWLSLGKENLDQKDVLSGSIESLNLATPGFITKIDKAKTKILPILKTSSNAMEIDASKVHLGGNAIELLRDYKPGGKPLTLAARVTGEIETAFPDGPPKEKKDDEAKNDESKKTDSKDTAAKKESSENKPETPQLKSGKLNAIVVADTDLLHDQFWVDVRNFFGQRVQVPTSHNAVFVVNALDNLSGGEALLALRGRGVDNRPFTLVNEIRRDAERQYREKEQALVAKLEKVQEQLSKIEKKGEGTEVILSDQEKHAIEKIRAEMIALRRELRGVKHALRKDIDRLDGWLKFINIAGVPILLALGGIGLAVRKRRQRQARS